MSDDTLTYEPNPEATDAASGSFGTFAEDGTYTPRIDHLPYYREPVSVIR